MMISKPMCRSLSELLYKAIQESGAGVRKYRIIDPIREPVIVYKFENQVMEQYFFGEGIAVGICNGFVVKIQ